MTNFCPACSCLGLSVMDRWLSALLILLYTFSSLLLCCTALAGRSITTFFEGTESVLNIVPTMSDVPPAPRWLQIAAINGQKAEVESFDISPSDLQTEHGLQKKDSAAAISMGPDTGFLSEFERLGGRVPNHPDAEMTRVSSKEEELVRVSPTESDFAYKEIAMMSTLDHESSISLLLDVPLLGMWQMTEDDVDAFRRRALAVVSRSSGHRFLGDMDQIAVPQRRTLQSNISPEGIRQVGDDQHLDTIVEGSLSVELPPPRLSEGTDNQTPRTVVKRNLLADISPPGIWSDNDLQQDNNLHKRRLLAHMYNPEMSEGSRDQLQSNDFRRNLLADISPPGMWQDDDGDSPDSRLKRRLLADVSPPGLWQGSDDNQMPDDFQK